MISGATSLIVLGSLGSVGIGTLLTALLTGPTLNLIMKRFGSRLEAFLGSENAPVGDVREA